MGNKRFTLVTLFLCFAMLFTTLCACSDNNDKERGDWDLSDYYDNSSRERTSGNLPTNIDLHGETVGIFYSSWLELDVEGEDEKNDIVYRAIYERNLKVKNWLNVDLNYMPSNTSFWSDISTEVSNLILGGDESMDIVIATSNSIIQNKLYNLFLDLNGTLYLELDQPWWNYDAIYETSVDGDTFQFLYGDMIFSSITGCGAIYYNKDLYAKKNPDKGKDYLYTMVKEKTWTFEQLYYLTQKAYTDVNGNQEADDGDVFGFALFRHAEPIHYLAAGCGVQYYTRQKNGFPKIDFDVFFATQFCELLESFIYKNDGAWLFYPDQIGKEVGHEDDFANGKVTFLLTTLGTSLDENMRDMDTDFGILPYPIWDDTQDYVTLLANGVALAAVPYTVAIGGNYDRLEYIICPVLEALSIESYRSVTLNFYELALKSAYTRDDIASEMIDIIVGSSTKNFLYEYGSSLSGIGSIFSTCMSKRKTFTAQYDSIIGAANVLLNELLEDYREQFA